MEEMYILHQLGGHEEEPAEIICPEVTVPDEITLPENPSMPETEEQAAPELSAESIGEPVVESVIEPTMELTSEPTTPTDEPCWDMELAQAYVRDQPLDGIFPPEEGLRMGTAFPNLSKPYDGRP